MLTPYTSVEGPPQRRASFLAWCLLAPSILVTPSGSWQREHLVGGEADDSLASRAQESEVRS